jgi:hypothetical protein
MPSSEAIFSAANSLAMAGWLVLLAAPRWRPGSWWIAGIGIPGLLALLYAVLLAIHAPGAEGGFSSLAGVAALFRTRACCWPAGSTTSPSTSSSAPGCAAAGRRRG